MHLEQLDGRDRLGSPGSYGEALEDDPLQSHYLEMLDAEAELHPEAGEEYIAHTEELMFFTSNEAREAFQNLSAIMRQGGGASFISTREGGERVEELKRGELTETLQSFMSEDEVREAQLKDEVGLLNEDIERVAQKIENIRDLALRREQLQPRFQELLGQGDEGEEEGVSPALSGRPGALSWEYDEEQEEPEESWQM